MRIKSKIRIAAIPYRVPPAHRLPERTPAVLGVIYLLFNEGYAATAGPDLVRHRPAEAIDLARLMCRLAPDDPETLGLYALLQLTQARAPARTGPDGPPRAPRRAGPLPLGPVACDRGVVDANNACAAPSPDPARTSCRHS